MDTGRKMLSLYRQYFKITQNCKDMPLKLYVRRRIREEYQKKHENYDKFMD